MPTSTVPSARARTHSWLRAYFRSVGILLIACRLPCEPCVSIANSELDQRAPVAHEGWLDDAGRERLAAYFHLHLASRAGSGGGQARERDRSRQGGRKGAAGDLAFTRRAQHPLMRAHPRTIGEQQAHELASAPRGARAFERRTADEFPVTGLEGHGPRQARFQRM